MKHGDIGEAEITDDQRNGEIVNLKGRLNEHEVISPRYDEQHKYLAKMK